MGSTWEKCLKGNTMGHSMPTTYLVSRCQAKQACCVVVKPRGKVCACAVVSNELDTILSVST